jgi:hypothetical protein
MGYEVPHLDRLADSCITHHADGSFYADIDEMCIPRNVAEMCMACLEHSDYRREELLATMASIAEYIHKFQQPDGGFASSTRGTDAIGWCGAAIAPESKTPRGNINGTQGAMYCLALLGEYLGWEDLPWTFPMAGWRERVAALKYRIIRTESGKIEIVKR